MNMIFLRISLGAIVFFPFDVWSITGGDLARSCTAKWGAEICEYYIMGASDMMAPIGFCLPSTATNEQVEAVVKRYLVEHPAKWHEPAPALIISAMQDAFPCR